jgi:hypothetical protein
VIAVVPLIVPVTVTVSQVAVLSRVFALQLPVLPTMGAPEPTVEAIMLLLIRPVVVAVMPAVVGALQAAVRAVVPPVEIAVAPLMLLLQLPVLSPMAPLLVITMREGCCDATEREGTRYRKQGTDA